MRYINRVLRDDNTVTAIPKHEQRLLSFFSVAYVNSHYLIIRRSMIYCRLELFVVYGSSSVGINIYVFQEPYNHIISLDYIVLIPSIVYH